MHRQGSINVASRDQVDTVHYPIVSAARSRAQPGQGPDPLVINTLVGLEYATGGDAAYRTFKIASTFAGDASFHIHWTKSANADESGNAVTWRVSYVIFAGSGDDIGLLTPTVLTGASTYSDGSVDGTRVVYRTSNLAATGFIPEYYVGMKVDIASSTLSTSNPVLISADLIMSQYINDDV